MDPAKLSALAIPERPFRYDERDTMLYALGIGLGQDPLDASELCFVTEKKLRAVPTMASVIGWDRSWIPATGINWLKVVHGEERLTLHAPLPTSGNVLVAQRVTDLVDKGEGKGAVFVMQTEARTDSGSPLFTRSTSFFARADGGFGGSTQAKTTPHRLPDRAPDAVADMPTQPNQALIYRLSGDRNPLHSDPEVARAAGFDRPILHGLCSYGLACRAVLATYCGYDSALISEFDVRFSAPVFPGEALRVEMWRDGNVVSYRAIGPGGRTVLANGRALLRE